MIAFLPEARFACTGCGDCCFSYNVLPLQGDVQLVEWPYRMSDGGCSCLADDKKRCAIYADRPAACRTFPFEVIETPMGLCVAIHPECKCILESRLTGIPNYAHPDARFAIERAEKHGCALRVPAQVEVHGGGVDYSQYLLLEDHLLKALDPEQAINELFEVVERLKVMLWSSEPIKNALVGVPNVNMAFRPVLDEEDKINLYVFRLWVWAKPLALMGLERGAVELYARWRRLLETGDPVKTTREFRVLGLGAQLRKRAMADRNAIALGA